MAITAALAVVTVDDLARAKEFYAELFGRPADLEPMPSLAQWEVPGGGGLQVTTGDRENSGRTAVTLLVTEFDSFVAELDDRGVEHGEVITGVISRVVIAHDPFGNQIACAEVPAT